jgi:hypothetical protein
LAGREKRLGKNLYQELKKQNQFNTVDHSTFLAGREKRLGKNLYQELKKQNQFNTVDHLTFLIGREKRLGNNLYQELSFQDTDALGDVDEGADLTGKRLKYLLCHLFLLLMM